MVPYHVEVTCQAGNISTMIFFKKPDGIYVDVETNGEKVHSSGPWSSVFDPRIDLAYKAVKSDVLQQYRDAGARVIATFDRVLNKWALAVFTVNGIIDTGLRYDTKALAEEAI